MLRHAISPARAGLGRVVRPSSTLTTTSGAPNPLTMEALVGISETVLLYLVHAKPGRDLDAIERESMTTGKRLRKMSEVLAQAQLHVIIPFGYSPDEANMRRFAQDHAQVLQNVNMSRDAEAIKDFQDVQRDIWGMIAKRAFGASDLKWVDAGLGRSLAMGIGSTLTNPSTVAKGEAISSRKDRTPEERLDEINNDVIVHAYKSAMATTGMAVNEPNFGMTYASMQVLSMSDPLVAQTMMAAMSTLMSRIPLLRGELK